METDIRHSENTAEQSSAKEEAGLPTTSKGRVTCFCSTRGGTGKTTTLINTAYILAQAGKRVLLLDMDLSTRGLTQYVSHLSKLDIGLSYGTERFIGSLLREACDTANLTAHYQEDAQGLHHHARRASPLAVLDENLAPLSQPDSGQEGQPRPGTISALFSAIPGQLTAPEEELVHYLQSLRFTQQFRKKTTAGKVAASSTTVQFNESEHLLIGVRIALFEFLSEIIEIQRSNFDHILIDTRGGSDFTTCIPALVADDIIIVMERDSLLKNQIESLLGDLATYASGLPNGLNLLGDEAVKKAPHASRQASGKRQQKRWLLINKDFYSRHNKSETAVALANALRLQITPSVDYHKEVAEVIAYRQGPMTGADVIRQGIYRHSVISSLLECFPETEANGNTSALGALKRDALRQYDHASLWKTLNRNAILIMAVSMFVVGLLSIIELANVAKDSIPQLTATSFTLSILLVSTLLPVGFLFVPSLLRRDTTKSPSMRRLIWLAWGCFACVVIAAAILLPARLSSIGSFGGAIEKYKVQLDQLLSATKETDKQKEVMQQVHESQIAKMNAEIVASIAIADSEKKAKKTAEEEKSKVEMLLADKSQELDKLKQDQVRIEQKNRDMQAEFLGLILPVFVHRDETGKTVARDTIAYLNWEKKPEDPAFRVLLYDNLAQRIRDSQKIFFAEDEKKRPASHEQALFISAYGSVGKLVRKWEVGPLDPSVRSSLVGLKSAIEDFGKKYNALFSEKASLKETSMRFEEVLRQP